MFFNALPIRCTARTETSSCLGRPSTSLSDDEYLLEESEEISTSSGGLRLVKDRSYAGKKRKKCSAERGKKGEKNKAIIRTFRAFAACADRAAAKLSSSDDEAEEQSGDRKRLDRGFAPFDGGK